MTTTRLLAGSLFIASFAAAVLGGQDGSAPAFPSPPVTIHEASGLTNAPIAATATVMPEPALPEVTVPKPTQIDIPFATAVQSGPVAPVSHPQPVMPPTTRGLLSKTMQSGPAGSEGKLASITALPAPASPTNAALPVVGTSFPTNSPAGHSNIWQKNTPSLNGVDYHW